MLVQRTGFTLVELIVVCVCGSLMLGLSLPMIQGGREEANRLACLDNLRNIGLASLDYNDVNGQLPPFMGIPANQQDCNAVFAIGLNYQMTYSLTQLLDFTGNSDLADLVDPFAFSSENTTIQNAGYVNFSAWVNGIDETMPGIANLVVDVQIAEFRCPSDREAPTDSIFFGVHPTNTANACVWPVLPGTDVLSITNYVGNIGALAVTTTPTQSLVNAGWVCFHGPMRSRQSDSVEGIVDGASNVVLFGESLGQIESSFPFTNRRFSMAMGGLAVGRADLFGNTDDVFGTATQSVWPQFGSAHPEVVNIVRADGSAQSINRAIDSVNFGRMCGVADGLPFFDFAHD